MALLSTLLSVLAPLFLIVSPITSYADQILAMHRKRSSAGFALDIPLIMLTASILKIFYWPGARFDRSLLVQAVIMVVVQLLLLKVALDHRPSMAYGGGSSSSTGGRSSGLDGPLLAGAPRTWIDERRPWNFWRWRDQQLYWQFLLSLTLALMTLHLVLRPTPGTMTNYTTLLGALGLSIEALLPIPQLLSNHQSQSCRGFRLSVLANWLFGDALKMGFFFLSNADAVPWSFKLCGCFQAACDVGLGLQYWMYGEGVETGHVMHLA